MSSLSEQLNSFKKHLKSAPVLPKNIIKKPTPSSPSLQAAGQKREGSDSLKNSPKKKKTSASVAAAAMYSQSQAGGGLTSGAHAGTQAITAIAYIKDKGRPVSFDDIERFLGVSISDLIPRLQRNDRIKLDMAKRQASYVSIFNIYSKHDLLAFLRSQKSFQGIPYKQLKDGWNGCQEAIEELEKSGEILVLRTKKENSPRYVWANIGEPLGGVDEEFVKIWGSIKVPDSADLPKELEKAQLKPTSVDPATIKAKKRTVNDKKQRKPRRGKITNTHMAGILKDYGQI